MKVIKLNESGYNEAMFGISLNKNQPIDNMPKVAGKLCKLSPDHSKFMRFMVTYWDITAPLTWWIQKDTYRFAEKNSESRMHSIHKSGITQDKFLSKINPNHIDYCNQLLLEYKAEKDKDLKREKFAELVDNIPTGWLQRRCVAMNYTTIQNIIRQRQGHKLKYWEVFISEVLSQINHPEFIRCKND